MSDTISTDVVSTEDENTVTTNVENVEETESLVPEKPSPADMFAAMDDANPAKAMVNLARTQLSTSFGEIRKDTERIEEGTDSVEKQIEALISDSEDEAIVDMRTDRDELEAQLEALNADLRSLVLDANPDLHPMTSEQKTEIENALATKKANHKSLLTAMEKALAISMGEADAKYVLSDLAIKARGGSGSGVAKPRFENAWIKEEKSDSETVISGEAAAKGGFNISSGHIADAINKACDFTAIGNKIKPSEITQALADAGYDGTGSLEFEYAVPGANKSFRIHVQAKSKA